MDVDMRRTVAEREKLSVIIFQEEKDNANRLEELSQVKRQLQSQKV